GVLCGRSGPNRIPWNLADICGLGIRGVLSVNDGESVYADELAQHNLAYRCVPLAANAPPEAGDLELCLERLPIAYGFVADVVSAAGPVLVHCRQGKDRTGLFMAYALMQRHALDPAAAIERVKRVRPNALSATGWERFGLDVLSAAGATREG
ncbi:MAG: dual specificity protein phosphatase family protein, partial [Pseudomonadota bacterium]